MIFNRYDILKLLALLTMVIDHIGVYLYPDAEWMRAIGRMAFPLFLFLVGYSEKWQFSFTLLIHAAIVTLIGIALGYPLLPVNILWTILITRWLMNKISFISSNMLLVVGCFYLALIAYFATALFYDYGTFALLFAFSGFLKRKVPHNKITPYFIYATLFSYFAIQYLEFSFHMLSTSILIMSACLLTFLIHTFTLKPLSTKSLPKTCVRAMNWISHHTLPLYTFHVILLMLMGS